MFNTTYLNSNLTTVETIAPILGGCIDTSVNKTLINVTKVGKIVIVSGLICFASSPTKVNEVYISGLPQAAKPNYYYQFKGNTTTVALCLTNNAICRWYGETPVAGDTLPVNVIYICV